MGWRLRRSVKLAPGVRLNVSRRGLGYSAGPRGFKIGRGADGRYRRTVSLPGTGLYNTEVITPGTSSVTTPPPPRYDPSTAGWDAPPPAGPAGPTKALSWMKGHRKTSLVAGALLLLLLASAGGGGETPKTDVVVAGVETREYGAAEKAAAEKAAAEKAARATAEKAAAEQAAARAAAETAAAEEAARVAAEQAAAAEAVRVAAEQAAAEEAARAAAQKAAEDEAARQAAAQAAAAAPPQSATYYKNCTAARQAGAAPVRRGDPGYGSHLDRDNDGVGCEN